MDALFGGADHVKKGETILHEHEGEGGEEKRAVEEVRELEDVEGQRKVGGGN